MIRAIASRSIGNSQGFPSDFWWIMGSELTGTAGDCSSARSWRRCKEPGAVPAPWPVNVNLYWLMSLGMTHYPSYIGDIIQDNTRTGNPFLNQALNWNDSGILNTAPLYIVDCSSWSDYAG